MSQEIEPPFSVGVPPKIFASCMGVRVEWVRAQIRAKHIPVIPEKPGHPLIDPNYANRVLDFKRQLQKVS
jgi:hypothetical protein